MIDVFPAGNGVWLARCECGATKRFPDAEQGWEWVLGHPCGEDGGEAKDVIDLTEPHGCNCN